MKKNKPKTIAVKKSLLDHPWAALAVLFFACLLTYSNSFTGGFMMDDHIALFGQTGVENRSFVQVLSQDLGGFYRPVGLFILRLVNQLAQHDPMGYHAANFFFFFLIVFLFFRLFEKITGDRPLAFLAALLYGVHPLNGMIVNYMTASLLATFVLCTQASLLFFIHFSDSGRKRDYVLSLVFFIFALLSHEISVAVPVYLMAYLFFMKKEKGARSLALLAPFFLFTAVYFGARLKEFFFARIIHGASQAVGDPAGHFTTWFDLISWFISKLVVPREIVFLWSQKYGTLYFPGKAVVFALIAAACVYLIFFKWKRGWRPLVLTVFIVGFLPSVISAFSYFPIVWPLLEPHWFYFSEMGFFLLAADLLMKLVRRHAPAGIVIIVVLVGILVALAWDYNSKWQTQEKYSRYWLSLNIGNLTPYYGLGRSLMDHGDCRKAVEAFQNGIRTLNTNNVYLLADAGHCFDVLGEDGASAFFLNAATKEGPDYAMTYHYMGLYLMKRGDRVNAVREFEKAVELDPKFSPSRGYLQRMGK